jgi:hypothetical protein
MNEFQLKHLTTDDLKLLKNNIVAELYRRSRDENRYRYEKAKISLTVCDFSDDRKLNEAIRAFNISKPLEVPSISTSNPDNTKRYLDDLIMQDWSSVYQKSTDFGDFYVYAHLDPRERAFVAENLHGGVWIGRPFYIGKGCKNRAWDLKRNQGHGLTIRQITNAGFDDKSIVKIVYEGLSEEKAFELESKLIYFFGLTYDRDRQEGWLLNLDVPRLPKFDGYMIKYPSKKSTMMKSRAKNRLMKECQ